MARNPAVLVSLLADWDGKDLEKAQREIKKLQDKTKTAGDKFRDMGKRFEDVGGKMASVGGSLTKGLTVPIAGIGTAAIVSATEFETSMAKITGLVGIASDKVDGFRSDILDLAGTTAKSPQELADALFVVTSAGLRGEDAIGALEASAKAGTAGLGETVDISRALAGALNTYGSETLSAAKATDIIVGAARAGNFETSQFAASIGKVLPNAKAAGASFEDTSGAVALLTRTNGDAARSITQVDALFRAIASPTKQTQKLLGEAGLSAQDLRDSMSQQGLVGTMQMLDDALGGNQEKLGLLLGSSEANSAAMQILAADGDAVAGTFGVVADSAGITDEAFNVVADTSAFKMQKAITNLKASLVDIGTILLPFVNRFAEVFESLAAKFRNLTPAQQEFVVQFAVIAAAIGPVLFIVGKFIAIIGTIVSAVGPVVMIVGKLIAGIKIAISVIGAVVSIVKILGMVLLAATGPIGLIVIAIGAAIAALVALYHNNETVRNFIDKVWQKIQEIFRAAVDVIVGLLKSAWEVIKTLFKLTPVGILITHWDTLTDATRKAFELITGFISSFKEGVEVAFTAIKDFVVGVFETVRDAIIDSFKTAVNFVIGGINALIGAWNGLSFGIPQKTFGIGEASVTIGPFEVGTPDLPKVPKLADGGIVDKATFALIGEAGPEAVVPLSGPKGREVMSGPTINVTVNAGLGTDGAEVGRQVVDAIKAYERRNGRVYASA